MKTWRITVEIKGQNSIVSPHFKTIKAAYDYAAKVGVKNCTLWEFVTTVVKKRVKMY